MRKRRSYDLVASSFGVLLALAAVLHLSGDRAIHNMKFNLGILDRETVKEEVVKAVRQFDRMYVALFTSGGEYINLNAMPASNLLKRRLVQDVNSWIQQDRILSHDRHALNIGNVDLIRPDTATVETDENWVLLLRSRETGRRLNGQKNNMIRVRYVLALVNETWKVMEFEVYTPDSLIPPLAEARIGGR